jgi:hypothetical protein
MLSEGPARAVLLRQHRIPQAGAIASDRLHRVRRLNTRVRNYGDAFVRRLLQLLLPRNVFEFSRRANQH